MNTQSSQNDRLFRQYFIAPLITGLVIGGAIFFLQYFLTPSMEKNTLIKKEEWISKRDTFITAIELIDKHFSAIKLSGSGIPPEYKPTGEEPTVEEFNKVLIKLILLSADNRIPLKFKDFFLAKFSTFTERGEFIVLLRKELFSSTIGIKPEEIPIFLKQGKSETK